MAAYLRANVQAVTDSFSHYLAISGESFMAYMNPEGVVETAYVDDRGLPVVVFKLLPSKVTKGDDGYIQAGALVSYLDYFSCISQAADPVYWPVDRPGSPEDVKKCIKDMGLSRKLSSQHIRPVPLGKPIFIKATVVQNNSQTVFIAVNMYNEDNEPLFYGTHDMIKLYKPVNPKPNSEPSSKPTPNSEANPKPARL